MTRPQVASRSEVARGLRTSVRGASLKDLGKKCFGFTKIGAGEIRRIKKAA